MFLQTPDLLDFTIILPPLLQCSWVFCRSIYFKWALQLFVLIGSGILQLSFSIEKRSFLDEGSDTLKEMFNLLSYQGDANLTLIRMAKIKNSSDSACWENVEKEEHF